MCKSLLRGVADDVKCLCPEGTGCENTVVNQLLAHALAPQVWLNEKRIKFEIAVFAYKNGGKPLD
jgi:hypothetical protein